MSTDPLERLAYRASAEPFFRGHALTRAQLDLGLSDLGLARRLGCAVEALANLRLCRLPKDRGAEQGRRRAERAAPPGRRATLTSIPGIGTS